MAYLVLLIDSQAILERKRKMQIHPYLCFEGCAEEAIQFYREALGAEVLSLMRGSEAPGDTTCEGKMPPDAVMHACLKFGETEVFFSDGMCQGNPEFKGFNLSLSLETDALVRERFQALAQEGQVFLDIHQTFFASSFGMVTDKFGVTWSVLAPAPVPA